MMRKPPKPTLALGLICGLIASASAQTRIAPSSGGTLEERYKRAEAALSEARSKAAAASAERDRVSAEELALRKNLVTNGVKVQQMEQTATQSATELDRLNDRIASAKTGLARDQSQLVLAIAVLQRIRVDQKNGVLTTAREAARAIRASQQIGAVLTPLSEDATRLEAQLKTLVNLESAAADKRAETSRNQAALNDTRDDLDRLIAEKHAQQESLAAKADELQKVIDDIGREAGSLKALMDRIAGLRTTPNGIAPRVKAVGPGSSSVTTLARGGLRPPVAGKSIPGDPGGPGVTPGAGGPTGLWYQGTGRGEAVAPADSEVVFAGPYQKLGQVLILELAGGYHLALAGLGRIDVHVGDLVLAGEPVGSLPEGKSAPLYMELRRNGKVVDPAPWVSADIGKAKGT